MKGLSEDRLGVMFLDLGIRVWVKKSGKSGKSVKQGGKILNAGGVAGCSECQKRGFQGEPGTVDFD